MKLKIINALTLLLIAVLCTQTFDGYGQTTKKVAVFTTKVTAEQVAAAHQIRLRNVCGDRGYLPIDNGTYSAVANTFALNNIHSESEYAKKWVVGETWQIVLPTGEIVDYKIGRTQCDQNGLASIILYLWKKVPCKPPVCSKPDPVVDTPLPPPPVTDDTLQQVATVIIIIQDNRTYIDNSVDNSVHNTYNGPVTIINGCCDSTANKPAKPKEEVVEASPCFDQSKVGKLSLSAWWTVEPWNGESYPEIWLSYRITGKRNQAGNMFHSMSANMRYLSKMSNRVNSNTYMSGDTLCIPCMSGAQDRLRLGLFYKLSFGCSQWWQPYIGISTPEMNMLPVKREATFVWEPMGAWGGINLFPTKWLSVNGQVGMTLEGPKAMLGVTGYIPDGSGKRQQEKAKLQKAKANQPTQLDSLQAMVQPLDTMPPAPVDSSKLILKDSLGHTMLYDTSGTAVMLDSLGVPVTADSLQNLVFYNSQGEKVRFDKDRQLIKPEPKQGFFKRTTSAVGQTANKLWKRYLTKKGRQDAKAKRLEKKRNEEAAQQQKKE
ncbi:MAG: hypothetical protein H6765_00475 [Candidatus Peribacteria bacterium]|nr:MAG: hypothetical protein H6765_00475 [Candidatus Peribacteria bacterium]